MIYERGVEGKRERERDDVIKRWVRFEGKRWMR